MNGQKRKHSEVGEHSDNEQQLVSRSSLAPLILEMNDLIKKPCIDERLSIILNKFLEYLHESARYMRNGIFNFNFPEASILLENSCVLYGKRVDLLWEQLSEDLKRLYSNDRTNVNSNEDKLLEKLNKFTRRKAVLVKRTPLKGFSPSHLNELVMEVAAIPTLERSVCDTCKTCENLWTEASKSNLKLKRLRAKVTPLVYTYLRKATVYDPVTGEKLYNNEDLYLNRYDAGKLLPDDKSVQLYNLRHLIDDLLQSYMTQEKTNYLKMTEKNLWSDFKVYLEKNIVKRVKALLKYQRNRLNGGLNRKRPLISQAPFIDLSMLPLFGNFNVEPINYEDNLSSDDDNVEIEDDSDDDESDVEMTNVNEVDKSFDSGLGTSFNTSYEDSAIASPASKSFTSRRTSAIHSDADSAFVDGDEDDMEDRYNSPMEENGDKTTTNLECFNQEQNNDRNVVIEEIVEGQTADNLESFHENAVSEMVVDEENNNLEFSNEELIINVAFEEIIQEQTTNNLESLNKEQNGNAATEEITNSLESFNEEENGNGTSEDIAVINVNKEVDENDKKTSVKKRKQCLEREDYAENSSKKQRVQLKIPIKASLNEQEDFFSRHYMPEHDEGELHRSESLLSAVLIDHCYSKVLINETEDQSESILTEESEEIEKLLEESTDDNVLTEESEEIEKLLEESTNDNVLTEESSEEIDKELEESTDDNVLTEQVGNLSSELIDDDDDNDIEIISSKLIDDDDGPVESLSHLPRSPQPSTSKQRETEMRKKLFEWRTFIEEKLKAQSNPYDDDSDFDIHEYGKKITQEIPLGETRQFKELITNKKASEVSRMFVATIHLANSYNVEILNVPDGKLANDTMSIKLISRELHHEQLQDFVAPSKENLKRKLKKVREDSR